MNKGGAARKVSVPSRLKGKTDAEIRDWARAELHGQEALLDRDTLSKIKRGELREVALRTRKSGFFLPGGEFVEAFDTAVEFGEDLDDVEKEMENQEQDWKWVDEENKLFNRATVSESVLGRFGMRQYWEHGKRVHEYVEAHGRKLGRIQNLLAKRGGRNAYAENAHRTASDLYAWKPNAHPEDPVFDWTGDLLPTLLRFSPDSEVRDRLAAFINMELIPNGVPQKNISEFLRGRDEAEPIWKMDAVFLADVWERLREGVRLSEAEAGRLKQQFLQGRR